MIKGIGTDIESTERFKESYNDDHFIHLIFTEREKKYCLEKAEPWISFAGKFCAKEAVIKASHEKLGMKDIEIVNEANGKLSVYLKGVKSDNIKCSISHTQEYAMAFALWEE